mgnify:CR=1 FL=1
MKKNQQKLQNFFEDLEKELLVNVKNRKGFWSSKENIDREKKILSKLKKGKENGSPWGGALKNFRKEAQEQLNPLKPGNKFFLYSRSIKGREYGKKSKRFIYIGIDNEYHIGRIGKPLKVQMK